MRAIKDSSHESWRIFHNIFGIACWAGKGANMLGVYRLIILLHDSYSWVNTWYLWKHRIPQYNQYYYYWFLPYLLYFHEKMRSNQKRLCGRYFVQYLYWKIQLLEWTFIRDQIKFYFTNTLRWCLEKFPIILVYWLYCSNTKVKAV